MAKTKSRLDKTTIKAWKFYDTWRKTGSYSPALKDKIKITRLGWDHLLNPKKRRTKVQKIRRLEALPLAKKLIENATTYQEYRQKLDIEYYAFVAEMEGKRIKVVISRKNKKDRAFLSVIVLR
mgnify:CR=1 FL=1